MPESLIPYEMLPVWVLSFIAIVWAANTWIRPFLSSLVPWFQSDKMEIQEIKAQLTELNAQCTIIKEDLSNAKQKIALYQGWFQGLKKSLSQIDVEIELPKLDDA